MRKKLRTYRQHVMEDWEIGLETCGIACILMLLDLYQRIQYPTRKMERELYFLYRCRTLKKGVTGAAAAECLSHPRNGLQVRLIHSSEEYLENFGGYYTAEQFADLQQEYRSTLLRCRDRITVETGVEPTCEDLMQLLAEGKKIMVQCLIPGDADGVHDHVLHWIVLYGVEEDCFLACDPLPTGGKIRLTKAALDHYRETPIGKLCIVVSDDR